MNILVGQRDCPPGRGQGWDCSPHHVDWMDWGTHSAAAKMRDCVCDCDYWGSRRSGHSYLKRANRRTEYADRWEAVVFWGRLACEVRDAVAEAAAYVVQQVGEEAAGGEDSEGEARGSGAL